MTSSMPWKRAPSCATGPQLDGSLIVVYSIKFVKRAKARSTVLATPPAVTASSHEYVRYIPHELPGGPVSSFLLRERSSIGPASISRCCAGQYSDHDICHSSASVG